MASYRCPVCGATHKEQPAKCRLCGQDMSGNVSPTGEIQKSQALDLGRRKGISGVFWIAAAGVVVLAFLALAFGVIPGGTWLDNVRDKIPFVSKSTSDGWVTVDDDAGRVTFKMPTSHTQGTLAFPLATGGQLTQWTANVGSETQLGLAYGELVVPAGESATATLTRAGDAWVAQTGGKVDKRTETSFAGLPAVEIKISGLRYDNQPAYQSALLILRGQTLYVASSTSIYADQPQYTRLVNDITFT